MIDLNAPPDDWTLDDEPANPLYKSGSCLTISKNANIATMNAGRERQQTSTETATMNVASVLLHRDASQIIAFFSSGTSNSCLGEEDILGEYNTSEYSTALEDSSDPNLHANMNIAGSNNKKTHKTLTEDQRQQIYTALLELSSDGRLKRDSTAIVAEKLNVNKSAVQRVWKRAKECRAQGVPVNVNSKKPGHCGRKKIEIDLSRVNSIPLIQRSTIRSLAEALGAKKTTLHRKFKEGLLRRHSSTLKPYLKEGNKKARMQFCISMLDPHTLHHAPKFVDMENIVHINEKWFYTTKRARSFYMLPEEADPNRTIHNKNSIDKVMFLSAVARPRYDEGGHCIFDGKIGVWPFIRNVPAKRSSRNRPRGTLVTKPMNVDRDTMRSYLITKVLPAIKELWPPNDANKTIWIQQDNARTHVSVDDEEFRIAAAQIGHDIRLMNQPPNSPDLNALDLGFFASLQSLTDKKVASNVDELILNVQHAFHDYDPSTLSRMFVTLQACMLEIMKVGGGNGYKIPHMNEERLTHAGTLPRSLTCDRELYESVMETLGYR